MTRRISRRWRRSSGMTRSSPCSSTMPVIGSVHNRIGAEQQHGPANNPVRDRDPVVANIVEWNAGEIDRPSTLKRKRQLLVGVREHAAVLVLDIVRDGIDVQEPNGRAGAPRVGAD